MSASTPAAAQRRADSVRAWLSLAETSLGNASDRLNAINIFPVADGDTGTNMYQTVRAAREALDSGGSLTGQEQDLGEVLALAGRGALDQARGNSGTLLAVMLTAMASSLTGLDRLTAPALTVALERARTAAWAALSDPQEGTMLTVLSTAAATSAEHLRSLRDLSPAQLDGRRVLAEVLDAVVAAAWTAVEHTEEQLAPLTEARVVDSGGMGLLLVLDALRASVLGTQLDDALVDGLHGFSPQSRHIHQEIETVAGYELMCTIRLDPLAAATLRFELNELGDSVIMSPLHTDPDAQGAVSWRLHAHVADPDQAMASLRAAGEPTNLILEPLAGSSSEPCVTDTVGQAGTTT